MVELDESLLGLKEIEYEVLGFYLTVKESHNSYKEVLEGSFYLKNLSTKLTTYSKTSENSTAGLWPVRRKLHTFPLLK